MVEMISLIIAFFLGMALMFVLLKFRESQHDGQLVVSVNPDGKKIFLLELDKDPSELEHLGSVSFKVIEESDEKHEGFAK